MMSLLDWKSSSFMARISAAPIMTSTLFLNWVVERVAAPPATPPEATKAASPSSTLVALFLASIRSVPSDFSSTLSPTSTLTVEFTALEE